MLMVDVVVVVVVGELDSGFNHWRFIFALCLSKSSLCTFQFLVYLSITFSVGTIEVHNYLTNVLFIRHPVHRIIKSST